METPKLRLEGRVELRLGAVQSERLQARTAAPVVGHWATRVRARQVAEWETGLGVVLISMRWKGDRFGVWRFSVGSMSVETER